MSMTRDQMIEAVARNQQIPRAARVGIKFALELMPQAAIEEFGAWIDEIVARIERGELRDVVAELRGAGAGGEEFDSIVEEIESAQRDDG